jgi:hypothetical protein
MLSRDKAFDLVMPFELDFVAAVQTGIDAMATLTATQRRPLRKRTLANMLNDYIVDDATQRLHDTKSVKLDTELGFTTFLIGSAAVRIKKVDKKGRYSNYPTQQQIDLLYQRIFPDVELLTQVIFGYRLDELWREIKQVSFVCWNGNRRHWEIPVADDLHAYLPTIAAQEAAARQSLVRPKGGKKRRAKGG